MDATLSSDHVIVLMDDQNNKSSHPNNDQPSPPPSAAKPPSLRRLSFSKPRSRFSEVEETRPPASSPSDSEDSSWSSEDEHEHGHAEEAGDLEGSSSRRRRRRNKKKKKVRINCRILAEWMVFFTILTSLVCSLTIGKLKKQMLGRLELWRWCLITLVTFSGRLVSGWIMRVAVFFVERNFMLREKVLYFVYGLRKSIQNCVWLGLVLLAWTFIFNADLHRRSRLVGKLFQALVAVLIAATFWLVKIILVKVLASSFHVATYFDRMKESVFHHYVLDTLSGPPMDEAEAEGVGATRLRDSRALSRRFGSRKIDMEKLRKLSMQRTASAWSVKRLVNYVRHFGLSTFSKTMDQLGSTGSEIGSEAEAMSCAKKMFKNVAKPGAK